jgi:hypothetical protein
MISLIDILWMSQAETSSKAGPQSLPQARLTIERTMERMAPLLSSFALFSLSGDVARRVVA